MESAGPALQDVPQAIFDALVDPTRRRLIERLAACDRPVSISDLAQGFPISRQAVTKHLASLEEAGLVQGERRGRERVLTFSPKPLDAATAWIAAIEAQWDARLSALQRYLAAEAAADTTALAEPAAPQ